MIRITLVVALVGAWSWLRAEAVGEVLQVEGEILGASLPWSYRLFDEQEGPLLGFPSHLGPVPYTGILTLDAAGSLASFQVSIEACIDDSAHCLVTRYPDAGHVEGIVMLQTYRLTANLFEGVLRNNASEVEIAYTSPFRSEEWGTSFALSLDRITGKGEWRWSRGPRDVCAGEICAPTVPGEEASGTISGFRIVPEPACCMLVAWIGLAIAVRWRPGRRGRF